jgi:hypothetical protein
MTKTTDDLAKKAKAEIKLGEDASKVADKAALQAEKHFICAGKALLEAKAALKSSFTLSGGCGSKIVPVSWLSFLKKHGIKERTAQEHMALASGKTTLKEIRAEKNERSKRSQAKKNALINADSSAFDAAFDPATARSIPFKISHRTVNLGAPPEVLAAYTPPIEKKVEATPLQIVDEIKPQAEPVLLLFQRDLHQLRKAVTDFVQRHGVVDMPASSKADVQHMVDQLLSLIRENKSTWGGADARDLVKKHRTTTTH